MSAGFSVFTHAGFRKELDELWPEHRTRRDKAIRPRSGFNLPDECSFETSSCSSVFSKFFALKLIAPGCLPAVSPELPSLRSSSFSSFLVHQFFLNIDHVSVVILPILCSEEISPGRLGKLSRQDEKTIKWLQEWVWCDNKPKRRNSCVQRSHVNEPLVNTTAVCCAVFTYFYLNCSLKFDAIKQPIKTNSVGSGHVSHVGTLAFEDHFDHSSVVFANMNRRSHA